MPIRKEMRGGKPHLIIDIPYRTVDGRKRRYRRDAQVQTRMGAEAEHRRLTAMLVQTGSLEAAVPAKPVARVAPETFADVVRRYRKGFMATHLKPSTRRRYALILDRTLMPRFGERAITELTGNDLASLDAELVGEGYPPATRRSYHIVFRSVLRWASETGALTDVPKMPKFPKVGRKVIRPMHTEHLDAILAIANCAARLAFVLAAYAGLRASEVRGLQWSDIDFKSNTITVRRAITQGVETLPKSHHHRVIPIATPLLVLLRQAAPTEKSKQWDPVAVTTRGGRRWQEWGLYQAFKRAQARADLEGWTFHDLRHFFVTELLRRGVPAPAVQQLAGHADLSTTQRYVDMGAGDLQQAIAKFG